MASSSRLRPMKTTRERRGLTSFPVTLDIAVEDHVDTLEDEALGLVGEGDNPLAAQDVRPLNLGQLGNPGQEFLRIHLTIERNGDRLHLLVMMMVMAFLQEIGLKRDDAFEIEGVALQNLRDLDIAFRRVVQPGIGVDGADARLDIGKLAIADEIDLVEQDHIGKGDLVLGFRRIFQPLGQPFGVGDGDHRVEPCPHRPHPDP